jgi:hypothetical protein
MTMSPELERTRDLFSVDHWLAEADRVTGLGKKRIGGSQVLVLNVLR